MAPQPCEAVLSTVDTLAAAQRALYRAHPLEMRPHFSRERAVTRAYRGRQLLELLQNADDAGRGYIGVPRFLIRLRGNFLVAANSGRPFSADGLTSLVVTDRSPKALERGRYIGQKGLGFRALLAWSRRLVISSGDHAVAFSPEHALAEAETIAAEVAALREDLLAYKREYGLTPVPVMRFPYVPSREEPSARLAAAVRAEGFDTAIVLTLPTGERSAEIRADIASQAHDLGASALLFSNHLQEIRVEVDATTATWSVARQVDSEQRVTGVGLDESRETIVIQHDSTTSLWVVYRTDVSVPAALVDDAGARTLGLAIAVPEHLSPGASAEPSSSASHDDAGVGNCDSGMASAGLLPSSSSHTLCVHFPTRVSLPMAMLAHLTLETDESRKRLIEGRAASFALGELAAFIARIAGAEAAESPELRSRWRGLALLAGVERCDPELDRLGFREAVLAAIRRQPIFPRIDGRLAHSADVRIAPNKAWAQVATREWLGDVLEAPPTIAIDELLRALSPPVLSTAEQARRLEKRVANLTRTGRIVQAGNLLGLLLKGQALPYPNLPSVLVDHDARVLPPAVPALLPPEGTAPQLPPWVAGFRLLHSQFVAGIRATAGATAREVARQLADVGYCVDEYQLETVARRLLSVAEKLDSVADTATEAVAGSATLGGARLSTQGAVARHRDILRFVFELSRAPAGSVAEGSHASAPISAPFKVVTEQGTVRRASECYVGQSYPSGALLQALFGPLGEDEFCAGPTELGLDASAEEAEAFLSRLGVAVRVRRVPLQTSWELRRAGLEAHVRQMLARLQYPQALAGRVFQSADEAAQALNVRYAKASLPDRWSEVLRRGSPEAIVAFVAAEGLRRLDPAQRTDIVFEAKHGSQQAYRACPSVAVSDPMLFLLRETPWVPCDDGERHPPRYIALSRLGRKALGRAFHAPAMDTALPLLATAGGVTAVQTVLLASGAVQALEALRGDDLYSLLLELPSRDPEGEVAPSVYRTLIEAGQVDIASPQREDFLRQGRMWGRRGEAAGYFPVADLRYAPRAAVPEPVRRHVALVAVDPRRSASEIERVFGVKPLDPTHYEIVVDEHATEAASWSARAHRHLRACTAHLYALRLSQHADDRGAERRAFADLSLVVAQKLAARVRLDEGESETVILDAEMSGLTSGRRVYVVTHDEEFSHDLVLWRAVADLVADVINVPRASGDLGPILACTSEHQRTRLLDHMTAGQAASLLTIARAGLVGLKTEDQEDENDIVSVPAPRPPVVAEGTATPDTNSRGEASAPTPQPQVAPTAQAPIRVAAPPSRASGSRGLVVTRDPGGTTASARAPDVEGALADQVRNSDAGAGGYRLREADSLRVAEQFELLADPPRFPLHVAHLRGRDALGCDMISLATAEARDRVLAEGQVELSTVVRFIEVKGATTTSGAVELTDNERAAAETFGARYFIYRVCLLAAHPPEYEIAVLASPVDSPGERVRTHWSYTFSAGSGAEWYRMPVEGHSLTTEIPDRP